MYYYGGYSQGNTGGCGCNTTSYSGGYGYPSYGFQAFLGFIKDPTIKFSGFTYEHRLVLYASIVIPVIIYFVLRDKDEKTKRRKAAGEKNKTA